MKLTKENILKLKYNNDPDYFVECGSSVLYYNGIFIKVLIKHFDFFNKFGNQKLTKEEIVKKFKIIDRAACVILPLLIEKKLLDVKENKYFLTELSKEFLLSKSEKHIGNYVLVGSNTNYYEQELCKNIVSVFKTGKPIFAKNKGFFNEKIKNDNSYAVNLSLALAERGVYSAHILSKKYDLSKNNHLVDIGGGQGVYSCFLAAHNPKLKIDILEIPTVVPITTNFIKQNKFSSQINVISGDMFKYNYNRKYDVHFYSNVLHDWDKKDVKKLLGNSYKGLPNGGKILIFDGHKELKNNPMSLIENDLFLLMGSEGRYYYYFEIKEMLEKAGFKDIKKINIASGRSLVIGTK
ncbi:MAG TPA: methyltransferase [Candidatus Diapherotrites archaeon]|nr:methyltransferase [Candidatus Diapherotrites archaeon]